MRILVLSTSYPSTNLSRGIFVHRIYQRIVKKHHKVTVVTPLVVDGPENLDGVKVKRFTYFFTPALQFITKKNVVTGLKNPLGILQLPLFFLIYFIKSYKEAKKSDVIHAHWAFSGILAIFLGRLLKKPSLITLRGSDINVAVKYFPTRFLMKLVLNFVTVALSNSLEYTQRAESLGLNKKVDVIVNGIDTEIFHPRNKNLARNKLGLSRNKTIFVYTGRLMELKGVDDIIEALPIFSKKYQNFKFIFIGAGEIDKFKKECKEKGILDYVEFVGEKSQKEIALYLNASDLFVFPGKAAGIANIWIEALASGTPVLVANAPGTEYLITHNKNGLIVPMNDPKAVADAMFLFTKNKKLAAKLRKNTDNIIKEKGLSWENTAEKHIKIYENLIK